MQLLDWSYIDNIKIYNRQEAVQVRAYKSGFIIRIVILYFKVCAIPAVIPRGVAELYNFHKIRGEVHFINTIQDRLDGVTVYIGDDLVGTVVYQVGIDMYPFNDLSQCGRVVMVRGGSSYLTLAEVEVYGTEETFPCLPGKL